MGKGAVSTTEVVINHDAEVSGTGVEVSREPNDGVLKTRRRRKPQRPDAMILKPTEKLSFADILGKVRSLSQLGKMSTLLGKHKRVKFCWNLEDRLKLLQKLTNPN